MTEDGPLTNAARYRCLRDLLQGQHKFLHDYLWSPPVSMLDDSPEIKIQRIPVYEWKIRCDGLTDIDQMIDETMRAEADDYDKDLNLRIRNAAR